jgi:hypothetical protein
MNQRTSWLVIGGAALGLVLASVARAVEPTAFQLIQEGNQYVGLDAKDKVVQIRSEKSVAGLQPTIWYIVYYDPDATFDAVEVKFGAGKKLDVKRPMRMLEKVTGEDAALDRKRLKVDSDRAIEIALKEPLLEKLTIKATKLELERAGGKGQGDERLPIWRVHLWAAKLANPNRQASIGEVIVSAEDGKVLEADLNINRVD